MVGAPEETSTSLLQRARADDPDAWQRIVRIYGPIVYGWARKAGLQPDDASDVLQEVFAAVARSLKRFRKERPTDSFRGWLWTVCRNKVRDHYDRALQAPLGTGGTTAHLRIQELAETPHSDESEEGRSEVRQIYLAAILECRTSFEANVWQAFWRVAVESRAPAEVATELGVSVWAVYKSKSRVLHRLRQELSGLVALEAS